MTQSKIVRLGVTDISVSKPPIVEYKDMQWRVWTAYNTTLSAGTYIELKQDGTMFKVTILPDGTETISQL